MRIPRLNFLSQGSSSANGEGGSISILYERLREAVLKGGEPASRSFRYMSLLIDREFVRDEAGVCLAFCSPDGDRVSTDTVLMLAYCLASELGSRVLIVDARLKEQSGGVTGRLDMAQSLGFAEILEEGFEGRESLVRATSVPNVDVLPAGNPTGPGASRLDSSKLRRLLDAALSRYDHVLVQVGSPVRDTRAVMTAAQADAVFVLAEENRTLMRSLDQCRKVLIDNGVKDVRVVVSGDRP